jgi:hypothetical protein
MQPTPLRSDKIGAILTFRYSKKVSRSIGAARLMGNPLGGHQAYSCLVHQGCCMVLWLTNAVLLGGTNRTGMQARGAECSSIQRCLKPNAYEGCLCWVWFHQAWFDRAQLPMPVSTSAAHAQLGILSALPPNTPL